MTAVPTRIAAAALPPWLAGAWSIERDLNEGRGALSGTAVFEEQPDGSVQWRETGELTLDGYTGPVSRTLFLRAGEPWEVFFDDGRSFHRLDLSDGACAVEHLCGPDTYRGSFEPVSGDELLVRWVVTGPSREDLIVSTYRRLDPRGANS